MSGMPSTSTPLVKPTGAWGSGGSAKLISNLQAPKTQEQLDQEAKEAEARQKAKADEVLNAAAEDLVKKVEACFASRSGGVSSNYAADEQYTVKGEYTTVVVQLAFTKWLALYTAQGLDQSLNVHMMQPKAKSTGGRDGAVQANFIRKIVSGDKGRFNIHINIK